MTYPPSVTRPPVSVTISISSLTTSRDHPANGPGRTDLQGLREPRAVERPSGVASDLPIEEADDGRCVHPGVQDPGRRSEHHELRHRLRATEAWRQDA